MGILDKARQAAEQAADATRVAADEARRRAEGAATTMVEAGKSEETKLKLELAGRQARKGFSHAKRGLSTAIDRIDPNVLADVIIKATSLQERANLALRDKGSPYRVTEIGIAASIPPQVTFSIGRIDDPEPIPSTGLVDSTELLEESRVNGVEIVALDGTTTADLPPGSDLAEIPFDATAADAD
jgi:hypothetical protein